ncbi:MAG: recombination mediator RecR [Rickettsiales bacterium]|jgi:recombination protein RecR|nr:recombination mediator RecR [Rickettsiales bacterium]
MSSINLINNLIKQFAKLPRVGGRAAQRIVLSLLSDKTGRAVALAESLAAVAKKVRPCAVCGVLSENSPCEYCADASRANGQLCIVRDLGDVWTLEKSGVFRGRYHIIGGLLSGTNGITPENLNIKNLAQRIGDEEIGEMIFALPNTIEGKTTQHFIMNNLDARAVAFSELASGVPLGGDLDYIDDGTLSLAFGGRKKL